MKRILFLGLTVFFAGISLSGEERVIAMSPNAAEMFLTLRAGEVLCGRCSACQAPALASLPVAGVMGLPSVETVFRLHPTMIVTDSFWPSASWEAIRKAGVRILRLPNAALADYPAGLRLLGRIFHREAAAEEAARRYEREIRTLQETVPARKTKVLLLFSVAPLVSCGRESFLTQTAMLAGGESITGSFPGSYFVLSPEMILADPPEAVIAFGVPAEALRNVFSRPEYRRLPAVLRERLIVLPPDLYCRTGEHLPAAIEKLRKILSAPER